MELILDSFIFVLSVLELTVDFMSVKSLQSVSVHASVDRIISTLFSRRELVRLSHF